MPPQAPAEAVGGMYSNVHLDEPWSWRIVTDSINQNNEHAGGAGGGSATLLLLAERRLLFLRLLGLDLEHGVELGGGLPVRVAHAVCPCEVLWIAHATSIINATDPHANYECDVPGRN